MSGETYARGQHRRKPEWLRIPVRGGGTLKQVKEMLRRLHLHTVCEEANCPNRMECFSNRTATFMILGAFCTRNCRFCNVTPGTPGPPDPQEALHLAEAVRELGLRHVVITSVTRDDLSDGGAGQFAACIRAARSLEADTSASETGEAGGQPLTIEVLIPDFQGKRDALEAVVAVGPDIVNHNLETVPRLYPDVRPQAVHERSLRLLRRVKRIAPRIYTKSGIMIGLGETQAEVEEVMADLRSVSCDFLTIGQYLPPSAEHFPVYEYVSPEQFDRYRALAYEKGFSFVASAPFVRSSYKAAEALNHGNT